MSEVIYLFSNTPNNPRAETYPLDFKGERTKTYVSLSLAPLSPILLMMEKSGCGPFRADFLFPITASINTLISKGCTGVMVQGTFSGSMTAWLIAQEGRRRVTAIFTDCKILREF